MEIDKIGLLVHDYGKIISMIIGVVVAILFIRSKIGRISKKGFKGSLLKRKSISQKKLFGFSILKKGVFISGASGSGKSESGINPIIDEIVENDYCSIIFDQKFDGSEKDKSLSDKLYSKSLTKKSAVRNYYFNLDEPQRSTRLNPLKYIPDSSYASALAEAFLFNISPHNIRHQDFWFKNSRALIATTSWWLHKKQPSICTLAHVLEFINNPTCLEKKIEILMSDIEAAKILAPIRSGILSANQSAGAQSSPQADFSAYCTPNIYYCLSGSDFLLDVNNPESKKRIVFGNNAAKGNFNTAILALLISSSIQNCSVHGRPKTVILLDEATSIYLPQVSQNAATLRSYNFSTVYCAQDVSLVSLALGGQTQADALLANLNTHLYGKCNVPRSADLIEKKFSTVKVKTTTRTSNSSGTNVSSGKSESEQDRPALMSNQIAHFKEGQFAIHSPKYGEFKAQLRQSEVSRYKLPALNYILPGSIEKNYQMITNQINNLFL